MPVSHRPRPRHPLVNSYWSAFFTLVRDKAPELVEYLPGDTYNDYAFAPKAGRSGFMFIVGAGFYDEGTHIAVRVRIHDSKHAKDYFRALRNDKDEIEGELGFPVDWELRPHEVHSIIQVQRPFPLEDRSRWAEAHRWTLERWRAFERVFRPRIKALPKPVAE